MARLLEDNEDDIFSKQRANIENGTSGARTKKVAIVSAKTDKQLHAVEHTSESDQNLSTKLDCKENPKPKARKRVLLTQRNDNPLLRPMDGSRKSSATSSFLKSPKSNTIRKPRKADSKNAAVFISEPNDSKLCVFRSRGKSVVISKCADDFTTEDFDNLSDFVVKDFSILKEDEDSFVEKTPPPPRSTRRLVQGTRPRPTKVLDDEDSEDDVVGTNHPTKPLNRSQGRDFDQRQRLSDLEEPVAILSFSPSENKSRKVSKTTRFTTPPPSPTKPKSGLISPSKKLNRIPLTPHRPSLDAFWSQDVINDWNDEFSPTKELKPLSKLKLDSASDDSDHILPRPTKKSPIKKDKTVAEAKRAFAARKHGLAASFLQELDQALTSGQVSKMTESTGGVSIIWSKTLQTTAGRANWRREGLGARSLEVSTAAVQPTFRHSASIELAEKVIDDEDRLLNVLAHEFCHLANFMISGVKNNPHGKEFQAWGAKCSRAFVHRGVEVTTKHSYAIDYKYVWTCTSCSREFKRHSKSIDPARHTCGVCKSKLVQTKPAPRASKSAAAAAPNEYQMFVKQHMKIIKEDNPGSPQKEIMGLVGKKYQEFKASKLGNAKTKTVESVSVTELVGSREGSVDEIDAIARRLNFIDLTSP